MKKLDIEKIIPLINMAIEEDLGCTRYMHVWQLANLWLPGCQVVYTAAMPCCLITGCLVLWHTPWQPCIPERLISERRGYLTSLYIENLQRLACMLKSCS